MHNCYVTYIIARARVHALCVLSGTFVGVRGIFVGVRVCVRTHECVRTCARMCACCVRACTYFTHIIFIPMPRFVY